MVSYFRITDHKKIILYDKNKKVVDDLIYSNIDTSIVLDMLPKCGIKELKFADIF